MVEEILNSDKPEFLKRFVLTVGVVSNHGNWFTSSNQNKELKVLAQSYDWLLFLSDNGLAKFIHELIYKRNPKYPSVSDAFKASYGPDKSGNQFTKVQMNYDAHVQLIQYFKDNEDKIKTWFYIITPEGKRMEMLKIHLTRLRNKDWGNIHDCR